MPELRFANPEDAHRLFCLAFFFTEDVLEADPASDTFIDLQEAYLDAATAVFGGIGDERVHPVLETWPERMVIPGVVSTIVGLGSLEAKARYLHDELLRFAEHGRMCGPEMVLALERLAQLVVQAAEGV
jgi:hypothetical protein